MICRPVHHSGVVFVSVRGVCHGITLVTGRQETAYCVPVFLGTVVVLVLVRVLLHGPGQACRHENLLFPTVRVLATLRTPQR